MCHTWKLKKVNILPFSGLIYPLMGRKIKIPASCVFSYSFEEHSCAMRTLYYQNCRRSSRKCEKTPKNDQFFTRTGLTLNRSTSRHMPGSYSISCAYAWAISWWSDLSPREWNFEVVVICPPWIEKVVDIFLEWWS